VVLALPSVVHAARGLLPLAAKLVAAHGAGREWESRPGRPDAGGASRMDFRMAGMPAGVRGALLAGSQRIRRRC
jgi:hypothetical protein